MGSTQKVFQVLLGTGLAFALGASATQGQDAPRMSGTVADEQAIYQSVLAGWLGGEKQRQMVDRRLSPPPSDDAQCIKEQHFSVGAPGSLKTLDDSTFHMSNVELVDGSTWRADDPQRSMAQGQSVDAAVKQAFSHSLFSFSQILFSADGKDALVSFGMVCGSLCGHGATLHMHKSNGAWKSTGDCGNWIS